MELPELRRASNSQFLQFQSLLQIAKKFFQLTFREISKKFGLFAYAKLAYALYQLSLISHFHIHQNFNHQVLNINFDNIINYLYSN